MGAGFDFDFFTATGVFVEGFALDFDRGIDGWRLGDFAKKLGDIFDNLFLEVLGDGAGLGDFAFSVVGVGGFAEFDG